MERNIISSWIDRNPMLHAKRTGSYLKYAARFWPANFDTPLRNIDQFRLYLADKSRCDLNKREQAYAERCREITNSIYAALVDEALRSATPVNYEEIERRAEKLLKTTPPLPIIIELRASLALPAVRRFVPRFGRSWDPGPARVNSAHLRRSWKPIGN